MSRARPRVLSIGADPILLLSRNRVLEFAGLDVVGCRTLMSASNALQNELFDVVILDEVGPLERRQEFVAKLNQAKPGLPVIVVWQRGDVTEQVRGAFAFYSSLDGPERLIRTVTAAVGFVPASQKFRASGAAAG